MAAGLLCGLVVNVGCGAGLSLSTYGAELEPMIAALDRGDSAAAVTLLNERLSTAPADHADRPLWLLERALAQLALGDAKAAAEDLAAADPMLEVLSLSPDAPGELASWLFSDSVKRYKAPAYEKLMVNVLGIIARLGAGDLDGARVEAKRLHAMDRYFDRPTKDAAGNDPGGVRAVGRLLAGLAFELSGRGDVARRWYGEVTTVSEGRPPKLEVNVSPPGGGELVVLVMSGRVPSREAQRDGDAHIVVLGAPGPQHPVTVTVGTDDTRTAQVLASVEGTARKVYEEAKPTMIAAAKTRARLRRAASSLGGGSDATVPASGSAGGWGKMLGGLVARSIATTMEHADVPDTRSWHTVPARISMLRHGLAAGEHRVIITHGAHRQEYDVPVQVGRRSLVVALLP